jgi:hypothetical protein
MALVRDHLESCTACAGEYRFEAEVLDAVRSKLRRIALPPDLIQRISDRLRKADEGP